MIGAGPARVPAQLRLVVAGYVGTACGLFAGALSAPRLPSDPIRTRSYRAVSVQTADTVDGMLLRSTRTRRGRRILALVLAVVAVGLVVVLEPFPKGDGAAPAYSCARRRYRRHPRSCDADCRGRPRRLNLAGAA